MKNKIESTTKDMLLKEFGVSLSQHDHSALTLQGYLSDVQSFFTWFENENHEPVAIERVTPIDMKKYKTFLMETRRQKANTINRKLASLSALTRWALESGRISSDPMEHIKVVRISATSPKWLDKHQQFALQRAIERDLQLSKQRFPKRHVTRQRDASLTIFMLHTGLRLNECIQLRLKDVTLSERKGTVLVQNGKGGKQRMVPLNAHARSAIEEWLKVRPESRRPRDQQGDNHLWVAVEADEVNGLAGRSVQRVLKRYALEAGLDQLTPHLLRHSFAKNLINSGVSLEKIALLLGHSNLNTTRIYVTPDARDLELAVEKLEEE